jgi:hypothetical protein
MFEMLSFLTNYKIMIPLILAVILGYLIYVYFIRKPVPAGEILADVKKQQLQIQTELKQIPGKPPIITAHLTSAEEDEEAEEAEDEDETKEVQDDQDDNVTRESLYEEILKLNLLKNPVDFIFTAGHFEASKKPSASRQADEATIEGLEGLGEAEGVDEAEELSALTDDSYPSPVEDFGKIADKINDDMEKLDHLNAAEQAPIEPQKTKIKVKVVPKKK